MTLPILGPWALVPWFFSQKTDVIPVYGTLNAFNVHIDDITSPQFHDNEVDIRFDYLNGG